MTRFARGRGTWVLWRRTPTCIVLAGFTGTLKASQNTVGARAQATTMGNTRNKGPCTAPYFTTCISPQRKRRSQEVQDGWRLRRWDANSSPSGGRIEQLNVHGGPVGQFWRCGVLAESMIPEPYSTAVMAVSSKNKELILDQILPTMRKMRHQHEEENATSSQYPRSADVVFKVETWARGGPRGTDKAVTSWVALGDKLTAFEVNGASDIVGAANVGTNDRLTTGHTGPTLRWVRSLKASARRQETRRGQIQGQGNTPSVATKLATTGQLPGRANELARQPSPPVPTAKLERPSLGKVWCSALQQQNH